MSISDKKQIIQDTDYTFPYHYVPQFGPGYTQTYSWPWAIYYVSAMEYVLGRLSEIHPESIADIGTGDGRLVRELSKAFPEVRVAGFDYSQRAIQLAKALNPNLEFQQMDITTDAPPAKFHVLTLIEVFEHLPLDQTSGFVRALRKFVRDDGHLIVTVPHRNIPVSVKHFQHFDSSTLHRAFEDHFDLVEVKFRDRKSPVVGLLRKTLENSWFILKHWGIRNRIYKLYKKHFLITSEDRCQRIYMHFRPRATPTDPSSFPMSAERS